MGLLGRKSQNSTKVEHFMQKSYKSPNVSGWPSPATPALLEEQRPEKRGVMRCSCPCLAQRPVTPHQRNDSSRWWLIWGTSRITPVRRQSMVKIMLHSSPASCQRPGVDLDMEIPLRHLNPPLQMALSIFGNRREPPGPLAYIRIPFWAIIFVFVDRNYAYEGKTLSPCVATHILVGVFCCITQSWASKLQNFESPNLQILSYTTTLVSGNATFQVGIGN